MRSNAAPLFERVAKVFGGLPILPDKTGEYIAIDRRRLRTENGLSFVDLEPRFYAVLKGCGSTLGRFNAHLTRLCFG